MKARTVIFAAAAAVLALAGLPACKTVVPQPVTSGVATYDGNELTSGIHGPFADGYHISARARARYNALIAEYGREFVPALVFDDGLAVLPDGSYAMTREALVAFLEMTAWRRAGITPNKQ